MNTATKSLNPNLLEKRVSQGSSNKNNKYALDRDEAISKNNYNSVPTRTNTKDALGCIFLARRDNITLDKLKTTSNDYIFDLTNTWELNLELVLNFSCDMFPKQTQQQELKNKIAKIKEYFKRKNDKRQDLANCKGKLLIEKQIIEEYKRKIEENYEIYKDQIREMEENVDNKEEYIKMFEKKLREVEIYVQKNTKNLSGTKFDQYKNFIMNDFINENTDLLRKRDLLEIERIDYVKQVEEAQEENTNLKRNVNKDEIDFDEDHFISQTEGAKYKPASNGNVNDEREIEKIISSRINNTKQPEENNFPEGNTKQPRTVRNISIYNYNNNLYGPNLVKKQKNDKLKKSNKVKNVLKSYNNHIKLIETRNKLLRAQMKDLHNKFLNHNKLKRMIQSYKRKEDAGENDGNLDRTFDHGGNQFNIVDNANNLTFIEKSNINLDITRKLATYMDFSAVLNKRDETNFHDLSTNKTGDNIFNIMHQTHEKHIWDVSCIEKN